MASYVGGLRARLILDNIYDVVHDGLGELGYLDTGRQHKSITVRTTQVGDEENVEPNIVAISVEDGAEDSVELGSMLAEHRWEYFIDVYAEDATFGLHLGKDIVDLLNGRFTTSVTRGGPNIGVLDLAAATPTELFHVELESISIDRSRFYEQPYQRYWWVISFTILDEYNSESD